MDSYTKIVSSKFIVDSPMVLLSQLCYSRKHLVYVICDAQLYVQYTCVCITLKHILGILIIISGLRSDLEENLKCCGRYIIKLIKMLFAINIISKLVIKISLHKISPSHFDIFIVEHAHHLIFYFRTF